MYHSKLNLIDTEIGIKIIKACFEENLAYKLNLLRVSAPLFLIANTGLNDNLSGNELPVSFHSSSMDLEIIQSLAKWKRMALYRYEIEKGAGIYTDMNAIRPCETLDNLHSLYVDQWDWEKNIDLEERTLDTLKTHVELIYKSIKETEKGLYEEYPCLKCKLPEKITFITTEELEEMFPSYSPSEREKEICKIYGAVFLIGIGGDLPSGNKHDSRSPDYDDWQLNGDIIFYHEALDCALEISSMGIRVDAETLREQLKKADKEERMSLDFHKMVLNEVLPYSIGGGIGESRLCMYLLEKVHVGEVQVSAWSEEIIKECAKKRIFLL